MGQYPKFAFYFSSFGDGPIREAHCPFFFIKSNQFGTDAINLLKLE